MARSSRCGHLLAMLGMVAAAAAEPPTPGDARLVDRTWGSGIHRGHVQRAHKLRGLPDTTGAGACVLDADGDGWLDLLVLGGEGATRHYGRPDWWTREHGPILYVNDRGRHFQARPLGGPPSNAQGCAAADFDNDGTTDLFITARGRDQLWYNDGRGGFERAESTPMAEHSEWTTSATPVDVNGNGRMDLYVGGFIDYEQHKRVYESASGYARPLGSSFRPGKFDAVPNRLYLNHGRNEWEEVTEGSGIANTAGRTIATYRLDVDGDGLPDLVEINAGDSGNVVYSARAGVRFVVEPNNQSLIPHDDVRALAIGDLDGDRDPDVVLGTRIGQPVIVKRDIHTGHAGRALSEGARTSSLNVADLRLAHFGSDGKPDLALANGYTRPHPDAPGVPLGQANTLVSDVGGEPKTLDPRILDASGKSSRSLVSGDFDNDGSLDLYVAHNNAVGTLLHNRGEAGRSIRFVTVDRHGHRGRFRRLTVRTEDQSHHVFDGFAQARLGNSSKRVHLQLEPGATLAGIEIVWPDGQRERFEAVDDERLYRLGQSQGPRPRMIEPSAKAAGDRNGPGSRLAAAVERARTVQQARDRFVRPATGQGAWTVSDWPRVLPPDEAVYWLTENLARGVNLCPTAATLGYLYDEPYLVPRTKYMTVTHVIRAAASADPEDKTCLLRALGLSRHFRALEAIQAALGDLDLRVRRAAVRALGVVGRSEALPALARVAAEAPVTLAAEAIVSAEQIERGRGEALMERRRAGELRSVRAALLNSLRTAVDQRPVSDALIQRIEALTAASEEG